MAKKPLDPGARRALIFVVALALALPLLLTARYIMSEYAERAADKRLLTADDDTEVVTLNGGGVELVNENNIASEVEDWFQVGTTKEETIDLPQHGFQTGSATLTQQARQSLGKLVGMLKADAELTAQVIYHEEQKEAAAVRLDKMRAQAIAQEMVAQGAPATRVTATPASPKVEQTKGLQLVLSKG